MAMNILFMTLGRLESIESDSMYADLLRCFRNNGHTIFVISPCNNGNEQGEKVSIEKGAYIIQVDIKSATSSTNLIKKGLAQLRIEPLYISVIKKHFSNIKFDLVLYSTPPITFYNAVKYVKKRDNAKTYLLLKDIFPQNAVDLGMLKTHGPKSIIYKYFRNKEKKLYELSDHIGCMSKANVDYILRHNKQLYAQKVEICPNSIEVNDKSITEIEKRQIREKYAIPLDKTIFVYGGNLGRPQGIPFLLKCLEREANNSKAFFVIVGDGSEYGMLRDYMCSSKQDNAVLIKKLPKEEYDLLISACDVGMIFLDYRFTIPNFPSRLLGYMESKIPVLACTDTNSDVGDVITEGNFGWWIKSDSSEKFHAIIERIINDLAENKISSEDEYNFLLSNYDVSLSYKTIMNHMKKNNVRE